MVETEVVEVVTRRPDAPLPRKPAVKPRRRRSRHRLPRSVRYGLGFAGLLALVLIGQLLLHAIQTEPRDARALTEREVRVTMLRPEERVLAQVPGDMADSFATVFIVATILVACCLIPAAFLPRTKVAPVDPTAMMGH